MKQTQITYNLPLSGQIIGEVFRILQISYPEYFSKDLQRYFRGERISDESREEILYILVDALLKDGVIPYPPVFDLAFVCHWGLRKMMLGGISEYADRWDSICVKLNYWSIPRSQKQSLLTSCFRLTVIDLAIRLASFRHLSKLSIPEQAIPLWAKRDGNKTYLKHLKSKCDGKPSNADLASEVGVVNDNTIDRWFYKGKRPNKDHLQRLAKVLARKMFDTDEGRLFAEMNRHYILAELFENVANRIGWDKVMELVAALFHLTARIQRFFEQDKKPVEKNYSHYLLHFMSGLHRSSLTQLLEYLCNIEQDQEWKQDIVCAERDWISRLIQENFRFTGESIPIRQDYSNYFKSLSEDPDKIYAIFDYVSANYFDHEIDGVMELWDGAGPEAYDWGEKVESKLRNVIQKNPDNAKAHLNLGAYLGSIYWNTSKIEEGFHECIKAIGLRPKWDSPRIEAANILLRIHNNQAALEILEEAASELKTISPRLAYTLGFARMMNADFEGSLYMFEKAMELKTDFALALDNAAYCALRIGDSIKGRRYAKEARQLGISTTYDMYDIGQIKQKQEGFPYKVLCETVPCIERDCKDRETSEDLKKRLQQLRYKER
ncbi:tetratricopeptide repeat protein [Chloroflexota bacterium]